MLPDVPIFPYAPKLFVDYLSERLPGVRVSTKTPTKFAGPTVQISTVPAGTHPSMVLAWQRLVFTCRAGTDEETGARLCFSVRYFVLRSRFDHLVRDTTIIGEPGRVDLPDEHVPEFQVTIDVLLREHYPKQAATATA